MIAVDNLDALSQTQLRQTVELLMTELRHKSKRSLNTLLTRVGGGQRSTTGLRSAKPTRQVVPSPGSMVAVRWLTRTMVPTTV